MSQKGFAPIVIVLLITLSLGGYLIYSKSQSKPAIQPIPQPSSSPTASNPAPTGAGETASWKKITFNKLNFKVPPVYNSGYLNSGSVLAIDPQPIPKTPSYGDFTPAFSIDLIKNKTLDQVKQEFLSKSGYTNKEVSNISIDSMSGLKMTKTLPAGQDVKDHHIYDVYLAIGQDLYHFHSFDLHISQQDQQKYFDQILSTFKFIE